MWLTDTEPGQRFPLCTRANAGDVDPRQFTPLGAVAAAARERVLPA